MRDIHGHRTVIAKQCLVALEKGRLAKIDSRQVDANCIHTPLHQPRGCLRPGLSSAEIFPALRSAFPIASAEQYDGFHGKTAVLLFPCFEIGNLDLIIALAGGRCWHIYDHGAAHQSFSRIFFVNLCLCFDFPNCWVSPKSRPLEEMFLQRLGRCIKNPQSFHDPRSFENLGAAQVGKLSDEYE